MDSVALTRRQTTLQLKRLRKAIEIVRTYIRLIENPPLCLEDKRPRPKPIHFPQADFRAVAGFITKHDKKELKKLRKLTERNRFSNPIITDDVFETRDINIYESNLRKFIEPLDSGRDFMEYILMETMDNSSIDCNHI